MSDTDVQRIFEALNDLKEGQAEQRTVSAVIVAQFDSFKERDKDSHAACDARFNNIAVEVVKLHDTNSTHYKALIVAFITALGALLAPYFHGR